MNGCILVFGMPRSGTTWIGKLFDSHPDTLYRHEPDSVRRIALPLYPEADIAPAHRAELQAFVAALPQMRSVKVVGKQPLFAKSYQSAAVFGAYRISALLARAGDRTRWNCPCLYRPTGSGCQRVRLVWKSIESPGRIRACIDALPDARAIYLLRHPCGYVASILRGETASRFGDPEPIADRLWIHRILLATATGQAHGLSLEDLKRLTPEERLAWRWVLTQEKILADIEHCGRVLVLRYEDVCAEPLAMTRRMFEFTGLDWQPQTEAFVRASTRATNSDYYSVFKRPQAAAERWRSELAPQVIERILRIFRTSSLCHFYPDDAPMQATREATA